MSQETYEFDSDHARGHANADNDAYPEARCTVRRVVGTHDAEVIPEREGDQPIGHHGGDKREGCFFVGPHRERAHNLHGVDHDEQGGKTK